MQTDKKFRSQRCMRWPADGHTMNLYVNAYLNVEVRDDKFMDYVAAGLEQLAAELRQEAADKRGRYLQAQIVSQPVQAPLVPGEEKEMTRETKVAEREAVQLEKSA